jgi:hypothetical protein
MNLHGFRAYCDARIGKSPYFQNLLTHRVNEKLSCNIAVCGEGGKYTFSCMSTVGKSYLASDFARVHEGLDDKGNDRFSLDQVCYFFSEYMDLTRKLPLGKCCVFDEPSYAMGKREFD